nr:hypothetical protein CFP56_00472 [Quercus suber]
MLSCLPFPVCHISDLVPCVARADLPVRACHCTLPDNDASRMICDSFRRWSSVELATDQGEISWVSVPYFTACACYVVWKARQNEWDLSGKLGEISSSCERTGFSCSWCLHARWQG